MMRAAVSCAALLVLWSTAASYAVAQERPAAKADDLDVTMQIIVDPNARLPDEVVRRIPLPARKPERPGVGGTARTSGKSAASAKGQERASEARELGQDMAERAKERAQEAAEQREQARRSAAEDHRRNPGPPVDPPRPPRN